MTWKVANKADQMVRIFAWMAYESPLSTPNSLRKAGMPRRFPGMENSTPTMMALLCERRGVSAAPSQCSGRQTALFKYSSTVCWWRRGLTHLHSQDQKQNLLVLEKHFPGATALFLRLGGTENHVTEMLILGLH
jgi:hypothetical protein